MDLLLISCCHMSGQLLEQRPQREQYRSHGCMHIRSHIDSSCHYRGWRTSCGWYGGRRCCGTGAPAAPAPWPPATRSAPRIPPAAPPAGAALLHRIHWTVNTNSNLAHVRRSAPCRLHAERSICWEEIMGRMACQGMCALRVMQPGTAVWRWGRQRRRDATARQGRQRRQQRLRRHRG